MKILWFFSSSRIIRDCKSWNENCQKLWNCHDDDQNYIHWVFLMDCTSRIHFLRAVGGLLCNSRKKDWNDVEEMKGWDLGQCPLLLSYNIVRNDDFSDLWECNEVFERWSTDSTMCLSSWFSERETETLTCVEIILWLICFRFSRKYLVWNRVWKCLWCSCQKNMSADSEHGHFWEVLVDEHFYRDSNCKHVNVQIKVVFSFIMTVMDKISGREEEKLAGWVQSSRGACGSTLLTDGQNPTLEMEEYLKHRLMSIMICRKTVYAGTCVIHEWEFESTFVE